MRPAATAAAPLQAGDHAGAGEERTHSVLKEAASCRNYESIKRTKRIKVHPLTHGLTHEMPSACVEAGPLGLWSTSKEELCTAIHSNSQLTDCFVSLALRRAAHDCITGDRSSGAALRLY